MVCQAWKGLFHAKQQIIMAIKGDVWFNADMIGKITSIEEMYENLLAGGIVLCTKDQMKWLIDEIDKQKATQGFTFLRYQENVDDDNVVFGIRLAYTDK